MMMRTPSRFRKSYLEGYTLAWVVALVIVVLGFLIGPWLRDVAASYLSRTQEATQYALLPRSVLIARLASSEAEVERTRYQAILYSDALERVSTLERELTLRPRAAYGAARVVGAPPKTHYDTLLIDSGSADDVRIGDSATQDGIAVGMVTDVSEHSATVELYSSPGATHDVRVGSDAAIVVATGLGGGALGALVPGTLDVQVGDTVADAQSGVVFGYVQSVTKREIDTEQYLAIGLAFSPSEIRHVSLMHAP